MRPIKKKSDYKKVMERIEALMNKGSSNVIQKDLAEIRELAFSAQEYEKSIYVVEPPKTLAGMIEMKMYELRLKHIPGFYPGLYRFKTTKILEFYTIFYYIDFKINL